MGKKASKKNGREKKTPVLIRWLDSYGPTGRWQEVTDLEPDRLEVTSVGWIVSQDSDWLVVVPHKIQGNGRVAQQGCGEMTIPKKAVLDIRSLSPTSS